MKVLKNLSVALIFIFLVSCKEGKSPDKIDLNELTVTQIHDAYKKGEYTAESLVTAYLNRIKEKDSLLNSITIINLKAIELAKKADKEFKKTGKLKSLQGIPLIVKDNINTKGMPTTAGAVALKNYIPTEDAFIIKKLIEAGAIIIGKSNMAEWAFSPMHTFSSTAGTTKNPYNTAHVPAGSSGGTGAAIAANFGVLGLGTDTGNSIRGPSSHNALVGFRTTLGLVSRSAIVPLYLRNDVVGPMCRTVTDATKVLEVIVGYDKDDTLTTYGKEKAKKNYQQYLQQDGLKGARIGVLRALSNASADKDITTVFNTSLKDLKKLGATIIDSVNIPNFSKLRQDQWCATFKEDVEAFLATYVKNDSIKTLEDIQEIGTMSEYVREGIATFITAKGRWGKKDIPCKNVYEDERRIAFRLAIEKVMDDLQLDAIVYPSWNNRPALITKFQEEYKGDNSQIISPHTGQPAFTVPMGYNKNGLPVGLQFLGKMYSEPTLVKLCYAFEQGTKHRKPPKHFEN